MKWTFAKKEKTNKQHVNTNKLQQYLHYCQQSVSQPPMVITKTYHLTLLLELPLVHQDLTLGFKATIVRNFHLLQIFVEKRSMLPGNVAKTLWK